MYEVYWDDSGTHRDSPIAIAACYVSTKRGWEAFIEAFNDIRWSEGFDVFHMADFASFHDKTKKPFCDWDYVKRKRVYKRIAEAINENKRVGMGISIPKEPFDTLVSQVPDWLKWRLGKYHYTFAVRSLMGKIKDWRLYYGITLPMRYVFDTESRSDAREEIDMMWRDIEKREEWAKWYGIESYDGHSFENRADFKPLQAADVLAWQMNSHMRNVILAGKHDVNDCHPHFRILRLDQDMALGWINERQLRDLIEKEIAHREKHGTQHERF
jgi:Protein of unknown function (DUF3800)